MAINDSLQLKHTMNAAQMENPYQATVVRTDINRAIPALIPELLDESIMTMNEVFDFTGDRSQCSLMFTELGSLDMFLQNPFPFLYLRL